MLGLPATTISAGNLGLLTRRLTHPWNVQLLIPWSSTSIKFAPMSLSVNEALAGDYGRRDDHCVEHVETMNL